MFVRFTPYGRTLDGWAEYALAWLFTEADIITHDFDSKVWKLTAFA